MNRIKMNEKRIWNFWNAALVLAITMTFVMPVTAFTNIGSINSTNIKNTTNIKKIETIENTNIDIKEVSSSHDSNSIHDNLVTKRHDNDQLSNTNYNRVHMKCTQNGANTRYTDKTMRTNMNPTALSPIDVFEKNEPTIFNSRGDTFYGMNVNPGHDIISFESDNPGSINSIAIANSSNFLSGGTWTTDGVWYACEYGMYSDSNIWTIDETDGTMTLIGTATGIGSLNGLAFDPTSDILYGCTDSFLYVIDMNTADATLVGIFGIPAEFAMIGIACDNAGNMYGYTVSADVMDSLYSIDTSTGTATEIGSLGMSMYYAQDPAYDIDNDILYLAANAQYGVSGLYICNTSTAAVTLVGNFQGGALIDAFAIPFTAPPLEHDVSLNYINSPNNDLAHVFTPEVTVQNKGNNSATDVSVNMKITKKNITTLSEEDFEADNGNYSQTGGLWEWGVPTSRPNSATSGVNVWATNLDGDYIDGSYSLYSPEITLPCGYIELSFWHWYSIDYWDGGNVKISTDGGSNWAIINFSYTGIARSDNPYIPGEVCFTGVLGYSYWHKVTADISEYAGEDVILRWHFGAVGWGLNGWYIDDVIISSFTWENEYNQTASITIDVNTTVDVTLPDWTPSDLYQVEDVDIDYFVEAETHLGGDEKPGNDDKSKEIMVHYGYFQDVGVSEIVYPSSKIAQPSFIPNVNVVNFGQNNQTDVPINLEIRGFISNDSQPILVEGFEASQTFGIPLDWTMLTDEWWSYGYWWDNCDYWPHSGEYHMCGDPGEPPSNTDTWLITHRFLVETGDYFSFWYRNDMSAYYEAFKVLVSTDPDQTDKSSYVQIWDSGQHTNTTYQEQNLSLASYEGQMIYVAFQLYDAAVYNRYLYIDDVSTSSWSEDFEDHGMPPAGWTQEVVQGSDPDNKWRPGSNTTFMWPDYNVPFGDAMAWYQCHDIYFDESSRLYTPALDFSNYSVITLKFWMHHSDYWDTWSKLIIQASTDGNNWSDLAEFPEYDASDPGFVQHVIDLSQYNYETTVYIGFTGVSDNNADICIDNIVIETVTPTVIYNQTVYVNLSAGESKNVNFPIWYPSDWHSANNTDIDYQLEAWTQLGDTNPDNDGQLKYITLYYPYLHDVGAIEVLSLNSGIGQTFTPQAAMENFGQYNETNIPVNMVIERASLGDQWEIETAGFNKWSLGSSHVNSGLGAAECLFSINQDEWLITPEITLPSGSPSMEFYHYWLYGTFDTDDNYLKISTDNGSSWTILDSWFNPGNEIWFYETYNLSAYAGMDVKIAWQLVSNYGESWYIDDIDIAGVIVEGFEGTHFPPIMVLGFTTEYNETELVNIDYNDVQYTVFPDWTPYHLSAKLSGNIDYRITVSTQLGTDVNENNDDALKWITLRFAHDVGTAQITEPSVRNRGDTFYGMNIYPGHHIVSFESDDPGSINSIAYANCTEFLSGGTWTNDGVWYACEYGYDNIDSNIWTVDEIDGSMTMVGTAYDTFLNGLAFDPTSDTLYGCTSNDLYIIDMDTAAATLVGSFGIPSNMIGIACDNSGNMYGYTVSYTTMDSLYSIDTSTGTATEIGSLGMSMLYGQDLAYDIDNEILYLAARPQYSTSGLYICDTNTAELTLVGNFQDGAGIDAFAIPYSFEQIPAGTYPVEAIVENYGIYFEEEFNVSAKIFRISEGKMDELVYDDEVTVMDLDQGQQQTIQFYNWTVSIPSKYRLEIETHLLGDFVPRNDMKRKIMIVNVSDSIPPETVHELDGVMGENDWYISCIEVTLIATDNISGVDVTYYRLNGGNWNEYTVPFEVCEDIEHLLEYYSVDYNGNEEDIKSANFKIDQTPPTIVLTWDGENKIIIADVDDETSGVASVELYVNDELVGELTEAPWEWPYPDADKGDTAHAITYDNAGNSQVSENINPYAVPQGQSTPTVLVTQIQPKNI